MNTKLEVVTLKDLNARLESAKAQQNTCRAQVKAAKDTFYANKDEPNKQALSQAQLSLLAAGGVVRKANEAVRVFVYQRKSLTPSGKLVRL